LVNLIAGNWRSKGNNITILIDTRPDLLYYAA
jgi:hypothetical protein